MTTAAGLAERDGPLVGGGSPEIVAFGASHQRDRTLFENAENRAFASLVQLQHGRYGSERFGGSGGGVECTPWVHMAASQGRTDAPGNSSQIQLLRYKPQQKSCSSVHHLDQHHQQQQRGGPPRAHPNAMARRNERERKRVRMVNLGFATLRQYLPHVGRKKLSKMETLRSAIDYIKQLQTMLDSHDRSTFDFVIGGSPPSPHPQWTAVPKQVASAVEKDPSQEVVCSSRYHCQTSLWDTAGWAAPRSPSSSLGSEASSPPNSLSPEEEILDFSALS